MKILALCLVLFSGLVFAGSPMPPATPVVVDLVQEQSLQSKMKVSGKIVAVDRSELSTEVSGLVDKVFVKVGDSVKKGQALLQLNTDRIKLEVEKSYATIQLYKNKIETLKKLIALQQQEVKSLLKTENSIHGSLSQTDLRNAKSKLISYEGQLHEIQDQLKTAQIDLKNLKLNHNDHTLLAPFDGQIIAKTVSVGNWNTVGVPAFTFLSREVEIHLDCPENLSSIDLTSLKEIDIYTEGGSLLTKIDRLKMNRIIDLKSQTFKLIGLPKDSKQFLPGLSLEAEIPYGKKEQTLTTNNNAILKNDTGNFVYKVIPGQAGKMVLPMKVQILFRGVERSAIMSPAIRKGDQLVSEGAQRLFPMTPVRILEGN